MDISPAAGCSPVMVVGSRLLLLPSMSYVVFLSDPFRVTFSTVTPSLSFDIICIHTVFETGQKWIA